MKDENGRGAIRLHHKTTHGGEVITACDEVKAMGISVALKEDMTGCPQCKGKLTQQAGTSATDRAQIDATIRQFYALSHLEASSVFGRPGPLVSPP